MCSYRGAAGVVLALTAILAASTAGAEIVTFSGSAAVSITELGGESELTTGNRTAEVTASYPDEIGTLPLQPVVSLAAPEEEAAGSVAAQFADPTTATGDNPEQFAINLTLNSLSPTLYYTGEASTEELRTILISPGEAGAVFPGQVVTLRGRLFLDGVLAVFAAESAVDLTSVEVKVHVTIAKEVSGQEPETVFDGYLLVTGGSDGQVTISASGDLPTRGITDSDLSALDEELSVFRAFVFPDLQLDYTYRATAGQPLGLRATVAVTASNAAGGVGVAAILGAPLDTLEEVIELTRDAAAAAKMSEALRGARSDPVGEPAFAAKPAPLATLPACGLFGMESLLGVLGLVGTRQAVVRRKRRA